MALATQSGRAGVRRRNVTALAPVMTATAERAAAAHAWRRNPEVSREMLSATFEVICEVALSATGTSTPTPIAMPSSDISRPLGRRLCSTFFRVPGWFHGGGATRSRRGSNHAQHGSPDY